MSVFTCWLCGEPSTACSNCAELLPHSSESVCYFVKRLGVKSSIDPDGDVVCYQCFNLVVKADKLTYELDACVNEMRSKTEKGETAM
jgi:hypothetical protein